MKRFTETNKWRDAWFRKLTAPAKLVWIYLCENCDAIGMIEIDLKLISDDCGWKITEANLAEMGERVQKISADRFFIPRFIYFQYGDLTPTCAPHRSIIKLVEIHQLTKQGLLYFHPNGVPLSASGESPKKPAAPKAAPDQATALAIYDAYPRHIARADALNAIEKALKKVSAEELLQKTKDYARARAGQDDHYTPYPATWFNRESYHDDPATWKTNTDTNGKPASVFELKTVIEAKQKLATDLKNRHATEGPLSTDWDSDKSRELYGRLAGEIKTLTAKLASL